MQSKKFLLREVPKIHAEEKRTKKLYRTCCSGVKNKYYLIIISFKLNKRCKYILILRQRDKTRNVLNKTRVYTIKL